MLKTLCLCTVTMMAAFGLNAEEVPQVETKLEVPAATENALSGCSCTKKNRKPKNQYREMVAHNEAKEIVEEIQVEQAVTCKDC